MKKSGIIRIILATIVSIAFGAFGIKGTIAYLSDSEEHTNTFTVGDVKIDMVETAWDGETAKTVPYRTTRKNPKVVNTGVNDAAVFIKVTVPVKEYHPINPDGSQGDLIRGEILFMQKDGTAARTEANTFNLSDTGWVELPQFESGTDHAGDTRTYVFGYKGVLSGGGDEFTGTETLFDQVMAANLPTEDIPDTADIVVEAYAIQAKSVINSSNGSTVNTNSTVVFTDSQGTEYSIKQLASNQMSEEDLAVLYQTFITQDSQTPAKEADTGNKLDIGGDAH